jgi:hypothetical protein
MRKRAWLPAPSPPRSPDADARATALAGADLLGIDSTDADLGGTLQRSDDVDAHPAAGPALSLLRLPRGEPARPDTCPARSIAAAEVEGLVLGQVRRLLAVARTITAVRREKGAPEDAVLGEGEVIEALGALEPVWNELHPAEQARILRLLIERIDVALTPSRSHSTGRS